MKLLNYLFRKKDARRQFIFICMGEVLGLPSLSVKRSLVLWGVIPAKVVFKEAFFGGVGRGVIVGNISDP